MSQPEEISVWAADHEERAAHYSVRHRVFVLEQRVMELTDIDPHDLSPETVHVLAAHGQRAVGAVRLYPLADGLWQGDRLAVLPSHRSSTVGAELVRFAVATAADRGGDAMTAHIQLPNVRFFERLGWTRVGDPAPYCGFEHQPMLFDLAEAPDLAWAGRPAGLVSLAG